MFRLLKKLRKVSFPGFSGLSFWEVTRFFLEGLGKGRLIVRAQATSFSFLVAIPPTIIVLVSLVPYMPVHDFNQRLLSYLSEFLPSQAASTVSEIYLDLVKHEHATFLSISTLLGLYYASNGMNSILDGFGQSIHMEHRLGFWKRRVFSLLLLFFYTFLLVAAMVLITFSGVIYDYLYKIDLLRGNLLTVGIEVGKWLIVVLLFQTIISVLFNVGHPGKKGWRFFTPGSTLSTIGMILVSLGFAWYVNNFGSYNRIYGSVGTIMVVMLWLYFNIIVLLIGFELNASISRAGKLKPAQHLKPKT